MKRSVWFVLAAALMFLVGILRGIGGVFLLLHGNKVAVDPPVQASNTVALLCGAGLIMVLILFAVSAYLLLQRNWPKGWNLSWIAMLIFLAGGILNGYLLFGNPFVQDQIINFTACILISVFLLVGKRTIR